MKDLILKYFDAFSNLYGIISMKRAYSIIEKQNPELNITKEQFTEIVNGIDCTKHYYFICREKELYCMEKELYDEKEDEVDSFNQILISNYIFSFDDIEDYEFLKDEQDCKSFYVPKKDELLKYEDHFYLDRNKHVVAFENYLKEDLKLDNYKKIVEDLRFTLIIGLMDTDEAISTLKAMSRKKFKKFANEEQAYKFVVLYTNLVNNTRMHIHRGHTPLEIDDCFSFIDNNVLSEEDAYNYL